MRSGAGLPRLLRGVSAVASAKAGCRNVAVAVSVHGLTLFLPSNFLTRLIPNDIAALSKKRKKKEAKSHCGEKGKLLTCLISSSSFLLRLPSSLCASDPEIWTSENHMEIVEAGKQRGARFQRFLTAHSFGFSFRLSVKRGR